MSNTDTLVGLLDGIGDAIRAKTGGSAKLSLSDMPGEIASISGGGFDASQLKTAKFNDAANIDLSGFDTSGMTDMMQMFLDCSSLTSLDLSGCNTSNVTQMSSMFSGCSSLASIDLSDFDTSSVTQMTSMFGSCSSLTSLDLSGFNTRNVTHMSGMFSGCSSLTSLKTGVRWSQSRVSSDIAKARFPVAMEDENGNQFAANAVIPNGAHTYTAV